MLLLPIRIARKYNVTFIVKTGGIMLCWCVLFLVINVHSYQFNFMEGLTTTVHKHVEELDNVAEFGDAQHRGEKWYDISKDSLQHGSDLKSHSDSSGSVVNSAISSSSSSEASSAETKENKKTHLAYRTCTPCPHDMLKSFRNAGIKWICGAYQRARRSFKSICMMRYRNCQDGTLGIVLSKIGNETIATDVKKELEEVATNKVEELSIETRRAKKYRSTSSSSGELADNKRSGSEESLEITDSSISSTDADKKTKKKPSKGTPQSSEERKGWRKWHRKCPPCPDDMEMKWRNPRVKWICGAYQRARRSFKSICMMQYRNCQDGTMFTKIADHRCADDKERYGEHFFYDYHVRLSDDSSGTGDTSTEED